MASVHSDRVPRHSEGIVWALLRGCINPLLIIEPHDFRLLQANAPAIAWLGRPREELLRTRIDALSSLGFPELRELSGCKEKHIERQVAFRLASSRKETVRVSLCWTYFQGRTAVLVLAHTEQPPFPVPGLEGEAAPIGGPAETDLDFPHIVGCSSRIREVCRLIGLVAKSDATVLVQGESGTGKELVAEAVHCHSRRSRGPLVKVNCAAIAESLLESELFGHKKGAFTGAIRDRRGRFAAADRGTLVLDEISSMPLAGQAKLLRVLQAKEFEPVGDSRTLRVNVRVVAITNLDLIKACRSGKFREDLYYRLSAFPIAVPPLCKRKMDIPLLARHFLKRFSVSLKKHVRDIELEALSVLMDYDWPGNVRELENAIEYGVIIEKSDRLRTASLPDKFGPPRPREPSLRLRLQAVERQILLETLSQANWVKSHAARLLGIDRRNLAYFLKKHGVRCPGEIGS